MSRVMEPEPLPNEVHEEDKAGYAYMQESLKKDLAVCNYETIGKLAGRVLTENGIQVEPESYPFRKLCRELLKLHAGLLDTLAKREDGDYSDDEQTHALPPPADPQEVTSRPLTEIVQLFLEDQEEASKWEPKTKAEYTACLRMLTEVLGDVPVRSITYEMMTEYRRKLRKLPANMRKKPRYRDRSVEEILGMEVDDPMSITNVNKLLIRASTLFNYAVKRDFMDKNPAEGLTIKQDKREDEFRKTFTEEDLVKLFHSKAYDEDRHKHSYYFWLPILGLFTGCRLNELCQLHTDDIKEVEGVWVIDVNEDGEGKKVKTKAGRRLVPLHPFLVNELGFVQYVKSFKEERLFHELGPMRDGPGQTASKWFQRYRVRCGVVEDGKVFHSFRHTFIDNLKQNPEVDHKMLAETVGHELVLLCHIPNPQAKAF
jgi:integrase